MKEQIEKQAIEKMAAFLWKNTLIHTEDLCHDVAETVIKEGYRKQSVGEWQELDICAEDMYCSVCGAIAPVDCEKEEFYKSNFCPNCGAKMKGGDE
jgi:hypothetical protein